MKSASDGEGKGAVEDVPPGWRKEDALKEKRDEFVVLQARQDGASGRAGCEITKHQAEREVKLEHWK